MKRLKRTIDSAPFGVKLMGAFMTTILAGVVVVYGLLQHTIIATFEDYSDQTSSVHAQGMAPFFAYYFEQNRSWQGVERLLAAMSSAHGPLGEHLVLADASGRVLGPPHSPLFEAALSAALLSQGAPVLSRGERIGTLLANVGGGTPKLLETRFLQSIRLSILGAAAAATAIALVLGYVLLRQVTLPLRRLRLATHRLAAGRLDHRVRFQSKDVIGQLGEDFNQMAQKLFASEALRRQMVADIAHELRTPLTVLQGNLQGLREGVFEPTPAFLASLHEESRLLSRLVNDLRDLTMAEAEELYLNKKRENLEEIIERAVQSLQPLLQEKQVSLQRNVAKPLPQVCVDRDRIVQVMVNLLSNALRYTPQGSAIGVSATSAGGWVRVAVEDKGPGIDAKDLPFIFERFWRADRSRGRHSGGTGLGLAIVKHLVKLHGGSIEVKSNVGKGTTLVFTLPAWP